MSDNKDTINFAEEPMNFSPAEAQEKDLYTIRFYVPDYDFPNLIKENLTLDQVKENVSEYGLTQGHFTLHDSQDRELINVERTDYQRLGINKDPELFVQVSQDGYKRDPEVIDLAIQSITQAGKQYSIEPIFKNDFKEPVLNTIENDNQKLISNEIPASEKIAQVHDHYKTSLDGVDLKNLKQGSFIYAVDTNTLETQQLKFTETYNLTSVTKLPLVGNTVFDKDLGDYRLNHDLQPKEVITRPLAKEEIKTLVEDNIKAEKQLGITDQLKEKLGFEELVPTAVKTSYLIKAQSDKDFTFYDKSDTKLPAFEAHKNTLSTTKEDQTTISAMLAVAKSQNWDSVKLTGTEEFRREAWLQASLQGLQVKGYTPKESDMMELKARNELLDKNTITGSKTPEKVEEKTPEAKAVAVTPEAKLAGFTIAGKLLDYGYSPYPDKPNSNSFFIEVEKENGSKEKAWGIALADQVNKAGAERGDNISMTKLDGQKADILVSTKIKDANGQVIGIEDKPHQVQAWNVSVIEKDKEKANKPIGDLYVPQELDKGSTHAKIADHRENLKHQMDTLKVSPEITSKVLQNFDTSVKTGHAVEKLEQLKPKAVEFKEANKSDSKERDR